jgi:hypothetical protein
MQPDRRNPLLKRHLWPLLALLTIAACGEDDGPVTPERPPLATITIEPWDYLDNRFFRLDLPPSSASAQGHHRPDAPGRVTRERIDPGSITVYRLVSSGLPQPTDIQNMAATIDTTGRWTDLPPAGPAWTRGDHWRRVVFDLYQTEANVLIAVDLRREIEAAEILGVVYRVVDGQGDLVYAVGDDPHLAAPGLEIDGEPHYRLKLLKPAERDAFTHQYVLRNIYDLGAENIDYCDFDLVIERNTDEVDALLETNGLAYLRIFGLDTEDVDGYPGADGIVDEFDDRRFDLNRGLLRFPPDFPQPFAATAARYAANAGVTPEELAWDDTYLSAALTPEIYDFATPPSSYPSYGTFRLIATVGPG